MRIWNKLLSTSIPSPILKIPIPFNRRSLYAILVILVKNCSEQLVVLFSSPELRPIFGSYYGKGGDSPTGGTPQWVGGVRRGQAEVKRENGKGVGQARDGTGRARRVEKFRQKISKILIFSVKNTKIFAHAFGARIFFIDLFNQIY